MRGEVNNRKVITRHGRGCGDDYGCDCGHGRGRGYGFGYGNGCGYGRGIDDGGGRGAAGGVYLGSVESYLVYVYPAVGYARVGCTMLSIAEWRERWMDLVSENHIDVDGDHVRELFAAADEHVNRAGGHDDYALR